MIVAIRCIFCCWALLLAAPLWAAEAPVDDPIPQVERIGGVANGAFRVDPMKIETVDLSR